MTLSIIAAVGKNNELGKNNDLLWNLPADLKHFKETTSGHPVIMGQRTFQSLWTNDKGEQIGRPLPNRRNIIITMDQAYHPDGTEVVHSIDELMDLIKKDGESDEEFFVIGGGQIYKQMIEKADKLYITHVEISVPDAEVYFPAIDLSVWDKISEERHEPDEKNNLPYTFTTYIKKSA